MALDNINKTENFFVEGSGTAYILDKKNKLNLIHLQNMNLELTSTMENIYGGESNFSLYSFNTEKGAKVTFTNASWNIDIMNLTQGVKADNVPVFFEDETKKGATGGVFTLSQHGNKIDWDSFRAFDASNELATVTGYSTDTSLATVTITGGAGKEYNFSYRFSGDSSTGVSTSLLTTGIPGFVTIYHKSKAMEQTNGRVIRIYTTIFKARCDGHMTFDFQHKTAFAPELAFDILDPARADGKYMMIGVRDVTDNDNNDD